MESAHEEPNIYTFDPTIIPYQRQVLYDIRKKFDYTQGVHEIMLSGSFGSAKSTLMSHIVDTHCLMYPGATACLGRLSMPDLKETIFTECLEHLYSDVGDGLREGYHFKINETKASIAFANGSRIISRSWSDKKYKKARSLKLSLLAIEELVENETPDAFMEFKARVGRRQGIGEYVTIAATNPDSPSHWAHNYFIEGSEKYATRHVYYSETTNNPFLPTWYLDQLRQDLDEKAFERYGKGKWIELHVDRIYHQYTSERNFKRDAAYIVDLTEPIWICWDFNIGAGKPLSGCLMQFIDGCFHFFDEFIIDGADTEEACQDLADRGLLDYDTDYIIAGDATGASKSTSSKKSDYDIIKKFMSNHRTKYGDPLDFRMEVPRSNPPIRDRHNIANGYCYNTYGRVRFFVYSKAPTLHKGMRLTAPKKGATYTEDDSKRYQHVTTAATYGVWRAHKLAETPERTVTTRKR